MTVEAWLDQWDLALPSEAQQTCRLRVGDGPELLLERTPGGWLLALRLGPLPRTLLQGVVLQLLQGHSLFSSLTAQGATLTDAPLQGGVFV